MIDLQNRAAKLLFAAGAGLFLCACTTPAPAPISVIDRHAKLPLFAPDTADLATRDIAIAVLTGQPETAASPLEQLRRVDRAQRESTGSTTGLVPWAQQALNAGLRERAAYRRAALELLDTKEIDPALRAQLEIEVSDDPLVLADARLHDARVAHYGRLYNRIAAPVGRALFSGLLAPIGLAFGLSEAILDEAERDPLTLRERQALVHWKEFLERYPDAPQAPAVAAKVKQYEGRYRATGRKHHLDAAKKALKTGFAERALQHTRLLLRTNPEDVEAQKLEHRARQQKKLHFALLQRSLSAPAEVPRGAVQGEIRERTLALLQPPAPDNGALKSHAPQKSAYSPDEVTYVAAGALLRQGREKRAEKSLRKLAGKSAKKSNMARHAAALLDQPKLLPYPAFRKARQSDDGFRTRWILLGPLANGPRAHRQLGPLRWILAAPLLLSSVATLPTRIFRYPRMQPWPFGKAPAVYGRMYLHRFPDGEHRDEVLAWLEKHEKRSGNAIGALGVARQRSSVSNSDLAQLEEEAAAQIVGFAGHEQRRDYRLKWLEEAAGGFPETEAGRRAGKSLRKAFEDATPQHIQITRGFFEEQPELAGPRGLSLRPELLDDNATNGELHPEGVTLLGSNLIQVACLDRKGDPDKPPEYMYERVPKARLSRFIAMLEETSLHKALIDSDYEHAANANRDRFFERARLGLVDKPDFRPEAQSRYTFEGVREKYGLVQARESILPVDLVVQGSLYDLSLGAFPRVRMPKETPDAVLYR